MTELLEQPYRDSNQQLAVEYSRASQGFITNDSVFERVDLLETLLLEQFL